MGHWEGKTTLAGLNRKMQFTKQKLRETQYELQKQKEENARLCEALKFYAYKNNYFTVDMYAESVVHMEGGEKARRALEEVKK